MRFSAKIKAILLNPFKKISPEVADHFEYFWFELYVAFVHRYSVIFRSGKYKSKVGLKINFGSSDKLKENFVNIDFSPSADLRLDLRRKIPLKSKSCNFIFSEHFVEHLSYPEGVEYFFSECFRLLEYQGKISLSVPDVEWQLKDYMEGKTDFLEFTKENPRIYPSNCTTLMEKINFNFRQRWSPERKRSYSHFQTHRFQFDFETMKKKLAEQGFVNIERREFDKSIDSDHRRIGSLFVDAIKPDNT